MSRIKEFREKRGAKKVSVSKNKPKTIKIIKKELTTEQKLPYLFNMLGEGRTFEKQKRISKREELQRELDSALIGGVSIAEKERRYEKIRELARVTQEKIKAGKKITPEQKEMIKNLLKELPENQ